MPIKRHVIFFRALRAENMPAKFHRACSFQLHCRTSAITYNKESILSLSNLLHQCSSAAKRNRPRVTWSLLANVTHLTHYVILTTRFDESWSPIPASSCSFPDRFRSRTYVECLTISVSSQVIVSLREIGLCDEYIWQRSAGENRRFSSDGPEVLAKVTLIF